MKKIQEIVDMVAIRNHLEMLRDRNFVKKTDFQAINNLIKQLDQDVVTSSLELFKQQTSVQLEEDLSISKKIAAAKQALVQKQNVPSSAEVPLTPSRGALKKLPQKVKENKPFVEIPVETSSPNDE